MAITLHVRGVHQLLSKLHYCISSTQGIVRALSEYQHKLLENNVSIFVRRGGPNYQEGLRVMREVGQKLGLDMHVYGPETHMTAIVGMALGTRPISKVRYRDPTPEPPSQKKQKLASAGNKSVRDHEIECVVHAYMYMCMVSICMIHKIQPYVHVHVHVHVVRFVLVKCMYRANGFPFSPETGKKGHLLTVDTVLYPLRFSPLCLSRPPPPP